MARRRIDDDLIADARKFAQLGLGNGPIAEALGVATSSLRNNARLKEAIREGRKEARVRLLVKFQKAAENDPTALYKMAEKIGAFRDVIHIDRPKTPKEALEALGEAIKAFAAGGLTENQVRTMEAATKSFTTLYDAVELQGRVERIEKMLDRLEKERNGEGE